MVHNLLGKSILIFGTGVSAGKSFEELYGVVRCAVESGIRRFDTAPSYNTEVVLADVLRKCMDDSALRREDIYIQDKIDAWQMQQGNISEYIENALEKMKLDYLDALLVHWPVPEYLDSTWAQLIEAYEAGLAKKIGICNVRMRQLCRIEKFEFMPHIVQIERNPLRVCERETEFCAAHGIELQAYSPLCKMDLRIKDNAELRAIAEKYGKNVGQIVMRWHIQTGVAPVFTTKKASRVKEYTDVFNIELSPEEIWRISMLNEDYKMYLESMACPGF